MRLLLVIAVLIISLIVQAQKTCSRVRLYAYQRATLPGMIMTQIDEQGREIGKTKPVPFSFYFYLEIPSGKAVKPQRLWLNGKPYSVREYIIENTPVILPQMMAGTQRIVDTLVNATSGNVIKINHGQLLNETGSDKIMKLVKNSPLVIEYRMGNRNYIASVKEIKKLKPLALQ